MSGEDLFHQLRSTVFLAWHDRSKAAVGLVSAQVRLTVIDILDDIAAEVAPLAAPGGAGARRMG